MQTQRRFSKEITRAAVQITTGVSLSIKQVAADLGIYAKVLGRWCQEQEHHGHRTYQG